MKSLPYNPPLDFLRVMCIFSNGILLKIVEIFQNQITPATGAKHKLSTTDHRCLCQTDGDTWLKSWQRESSWLELEIPRPQVRDVWRIFFSTRPRRGKAQKCSNLKARHV